MPIGPHMVATGTRDFRRSGPGGQPGGAGGRPAAAALAYFRLLFRVLRLAFLRDAFLTNCPLLFRFIVFPLG